MSRLSNEHLKSIDRALTIMRMHEDRQKIPKYKKEFTSDIEHLERVRNFIKENVTTPMFDNIIDAACELSI